MTKESKALARRATQIFNGMIVSPYVALCRPPGYQYQEIQSNRCLTAPAINMTPSGLMENATSKRVSEGHLESLADVSGYHFVSHRNLKT